MTEATIPSPAPEVPVMPWNPAASAGPKTKEQKWNLGPFGTGFQIALGALTASAIFSLVVVVLMVVVIALGIAGVGHSTSNIFQNISSGVGQ